jgi:protein-S-isoprenylcysteine O-methyltransferase Ste14
MHNAALMRRHIFPKAYADFVARLRVFLGFMMVAAFAYFSHPSARSLSIGLPVSVCGLGLRAWAAGHLRKNEALAESGPYAFTRNPLYLGTFIAALGFAMAARSVALGFLFTVVFLLVYLPAIELEEQHLRAILPGYEAYAARVPLIAPRLIAAGSHAPQRFSFVQYRKNREYEALLAWCAAAAWLVARAEFRF